MATTLVCLPGGSHGQRSVVGYGARGRKESDTTECACVCMYTHIHTGKPDRPKGDGSFLGSRGLWFQAVDTFLKPYVCISSKLRNL